MDVLSVQVLNLLISMYLGLYPLVTVKDCSQMTCQDISIGIQAVTLSGPVALFALTFLSACRVVVKSRTYSSGSWPSTSKASLFLSSRGRCSLTDMKKSFILLASSSTCPSVVVLAELCTFDLSVVF